MMLCNTMKVECLGRLGPGLSPSLLSVSLSEVCRPLLHFHYTSNIPVPTIPTHAYPDEGEKKSQKKRKGNQVKYTYTLLVCLLEAGELETKPGESVASVEEDVSGSGFHRPRACCRRRPNMRSCRRHPRRRRRRHPLRPLRPRSRPLPLPRRPCSRSRCSWSTTTTTYYRGSH